MERTREQEFLRLAVRSAIQDDPQACLEAFRNESFDWPYLLEQAQRHRIRPLLYHHCVQQREAFAAIPAAVRQSLQDAYQQTYLQNTLWYQHLTVILREFATHGIFPIQLKGVVLAKMVYRNIALRPMQDLDLLLREEELPAAAAILEAFGYNRLLQHLTYVSPWHRAYEEARWQELEPQGYHLPTFIKKIGVMPVCVELHHHLAPGMTADVVRSCVVAEAGVQAHALAPADFLWHLCFHLNLHVRAGKTPYLIWYADIGKVVNMYRLQLDEDVFRAICRQSQSTEPVFQRLAEVCALFALKPPFPLPLCELTVSQLEQTIFSERTPNPERAFLHNVFHAGKLKGLRYLWECLFPAQAFLIARYGIRQPRWVAYYYLLRFWKACCRGIKFVKDLILNNS